jgi:hypothetical protein
MSSPLSRRRSGQRQVLLLLDWQKLSANHTVSRCAHHWVTDQSIAQSLEHFHFDDPSIPHHRETHRADRFDLADDGSRYSVSASANICESEWSRAYQGWTSQAPGISVPR